MASNKNKKEVLNKAMLFFAALFLITTLVLGLKIYQMKSFLKGIANVITIDSALSNSTKKLIYKGGDVLIANSELSPDSVVTVASLISVIDMKYKYIPFYKKTYFVMEEGGAEGSSDCLIFDEDGRIIVRNLRKSIDLSQFSPQPYNCQIDYLGEDAKATLKLVTSNNKVYQVIVNMVSGKLERVTSGK